MWQQICNLIDEMHQKATLWLTHTFDTIIIPHFNSSNMAKRHHHKINSKTVCLMMMWAHAQF